MNLEEIKDVPINYAQAVQWLAAVDDVECRSVTECAKSPAVRFVAHVFDLLPFKVANDVVVFRINNEIGL